jgi:hypothetical protein
MRRVLGFLCLASMAVMASCSSSNSFEDRWKATAAPMTANPAALLAGKWHGTWQSDANDYHGEMKSIVTLTGPAIEDKKEVQQYVASIELQFFNLNPVKQYDVKLNATKMADGRIHFEGVKDLGYYEGGLCTYDGYVDPKKNEFFCEYNSHKDVGTFLMDRITQENK